MTEQGGTKKVEHVVKDKWTPGEVFDSLTGPDEDAVVRAFNEEPMVLQAEKRYTKLRRALVFVLHLRDGASPAKAVKSANDMTSAELFTFFSDVDDSDDGSEQGKDDSQPASKPTPQPGSGSASDSAGGSTAP